MFLAAWHTCFHCKQLCSLKEERGSVPLTRGENGALLFSLGILGNARSECPNSHVLKDAGIREPSAPPSSDESLPLAPCTQSPAGLGARFSSNCCAAAAAFSWNGGTKKQSRIAPCQSANERKGARDLLLQVRKIPTHWVVKNPVGIH